MILPKYDGSCGWFETLPMISQFPEVEGEHRVHTAIIGGGFVGVAAARRLAQNIPDEKIILLEALKIGQGASGKNSGFIIDHPHKRDLEAADVEKKKKIVSLNRMAIDYLEEIVLSKGIDCQWSRAGKYQGAVGPRGQKFLNDYRSLLDGFGESYEYFEREDLKNLIGTGYYSAAIYTPGTVLMQPAALMRGMVDTLPENVTVSENTPVVTMEKSNNRYVLKSKKATIICQNVILATNAFTGQFGYMSDKLLPVMTFASMTRPLNAVEMKVYTGKPDWGLTPADHAGTTFRLTKDWRMIVRNSYQYAPKINAPEKVSEKIVSAHRAALASRYPFLENMEIEYTWGGASTMSRNFENFFGQVDDGVFTACCDQSVGAARGTSTGMMIGDLIAGKKSKYLTDMQEVSGSPTKLPPGWVLGLGVPVRMQIAKFFSKDEV